MSAYQLIAIGVRRAADGIEIPADAGNTDWRAYQAWLAVGNTPEPAPVPDVQGKVVAAVQDRLDTFARTRGYDGILSACTYSGSTVPKFAAEGAYAVSARDGHWSKCYQILASVQAGAQPMPTADQVIAQMPPLAWPL